MKHKDHTNSLKLWIVSKIMKIPTLLLFVGFSYTTTAFSFLKIPVLMSDTVSSEAPFMFYNPACLTNELLFSLTHAHWFANTKLNTIYFSYPFRNILLGIGFMQLNYGRLVKRDKEARLLNDFYAEDQAFILSYASHIKNTSFGLNLKLLRQNISNYNAYTTLLDLSVINQSCRNITLGFTLQNINILTTNTAPIVATFGVSHKSIPLILDMRFYPYSNKLELRFKIKINLLGKVSLGVGYTTNITGSKQINPFNFLLLIKPVFSRRLSLQYTFSYHPFLNQIHLFSITFRI